MTLEHTSVYFYEIHVTQDYSFLA